MIGASILLDAEGKILRFEASGHSKRGGPGADLVCAAFTVLARTAYEALAALPGTEIQGRASEPGSLSFSLRQLGPGTGERAIGITDFLLAGISSLEREYPGEVGLTIERYWRE